MRQVHARLKHGSQRIRVQLDQIRHALRVAYDERRAVVKPAERVGRGVAVEQSGRQIARTVARTSGDAR